MIGAVSKIKIAKFREGVKVEMKCFIYPHDPHPPVEKVNKYHTFFLL